MIAAFVGLAVTIAIAPTTPGIGPISPGPPGIACVALHPEWRKSAESSPVAREAPIRPNGRDVRPKILKSYALSSDGSCRW